MKIEVKSIITEKVVHFCDSVKSINFVMEDGQRFFEFVFFDDSVPGYKIPYDDVILEVY